MSDNGTGETRCVSDGPQRKTTEENESLKYTQSASPGSAPNAGPNRRTLRADVGKVEMVEARAGKVLRGNPERPHDGEV